MRRALIGLAFTFLIVGCGPDITAATCLEQARDRGPEFTVAGSLATTVEQVRALQPQLQPARWPELAPEDPATLCYLDGPFGAAPGGGDPYDRALVAVADGHSDLVIVGYQREMAVPTL